MDADMWGTAAATCDVQPGQSTITSAPSVQYAATFFVPMPSLRSISSVKQAASLTGSMIKLSYQQQAREMEEGRRHK